MGLGIIITVNNRANQELTNLASIVEVTERIDEAIVYKIRFSIDVCSEDTGTIYEDVTDPGSILGVLVEVNNTLHCLVSGPVTNQDVNLEQGGAGSWLEVSGTDTSHLMDAAPVFHNLTGNDADIVRSILSPKYAKTVDVESTPDSSHEEEKHSQVQRETDLSFVRRLAQRNGFHLWFTYDKEGNATAYFKSRNLQGKPVADLTVNLEKANVDNLQFKWNIKPPTEVEGKQIDLKTKETIGDKVTLDKSESLGSKSLKDVAGKVANAMQLSPPADDGGTMKKRAEAALREAQWFLNATCKTTVSRICKLVRSHTLVNVQGAGSRYSGKYYVSGVKHTIDSSAHAMDIELSRNSWNTAEKLSSELTKIF